MMFDGQHKWTGIIDKRKFYSNPYMYSTLNEKDKKKRKKKNKIARKSRKRK